MICVECSYGRYPETCLRGVLSQTEDVIKKIIGYFELASLEQMAEALSKTLPDKKVEPIADRSHFLLKDRIPYYSDGQVVIDFRNVKGLFGENYRAYQERLSRMYETILIGLGFIGREEGLLIENPRARNAIKLSNSVRFDLSHPNCPLMASIHWDEQHISLLSIRHSPEALIQTQTHERIF